MSFLIESTVRSAPRAVSRLAALHAPRAFTASAHLQKTPTESVKDGLKTVDRAVSDKLVDGLDLAAAAKAKAKNATDDIKKGTARGRAEELKGEAKGKAEEVKGKAKGFAEDVKSKV